MFGVKKIEKVVADELYAAQRDALNAAGVVEQAQHALDVAAARLTMLNNRVTRLQMHGDPDIAPVVTTSVSGTGSFKCGGSTIGVAGGGFGEPAHYRGGNGVSGHG